MKSRILRRYQKSVAIFIMLSLMASMARAAGDSGAHRPVAPPVLVSEILAR